MKFEHTSGGFTLPGESGQEKLTLELAKKWGADVIRDSDGTQLSDEILDAGYDIYSTICIIRDHNAWAKEHPECLQQSFLSTEPVIAAEEPLTVKPMAGFFDEQFKINDRPEALRYWQVWDRTANKLLPADTWQWDAAAGTVTVASPAPFHAYTVSFLAWRTWEEINMYNHVTNSWTSEHLLPVDPRTKEAQDFLYDWLKNWCETHPQTNVVRFTSMFYNFVWIWGSDKRNQNLFTDWGSYDFTVSEKALDDFAAQYGYTLTAEDFINKGSLQVTHMPPTAHKRDYMEFTQQFVAGYGKKLVDLVHSYGKRAMYFMTIAGWALNLTARTLRNSALTASSSACFLVMKSGCARALMRRCMSCASIRTCSRWAWAVHRPLHRAATLPAMQLSIGTMSAAPCCGPRSTASAWAATCTF